MRTMEWYPFSDRQCKVFWFNASLKIPLKTTLSSVRLISQESKTNHTSKQVISCEILKQKRPLEIVRLNILLRQTPPLCSSRNLENLHSIYFPCTCSKLLVYYVMNRPFRHKSFQFVFPFDGGTGRSLLSACLIIFLQDHLLFPIFVQVQTTSF